MKMLQKKGGFKRARLTGGWVRFCSACWLFLQDV